MTGGLRGIGALVGLALLACGTEPPATSPTPTDGGAADTEDRTGPTIIAAFLDDNQPRGQDVLVEASISDPSGVAFAALYFRAAGTDFWASEAFRAVGGDQYEAVIPGSWVGEGGVDWYIEARDASFNRNVSYFPITGPIGPLYFSTLGEALPFPFVEDFEPEDPDTTRYLLAQSGWTGYVQAFFDGENWGMSSRFSASGGWSAAHLHGSPFQVDGFEDWLVSPPIDLSEAETVELYWHELIDHPEYATHRLMVSTTSPDPDLLGFVTLFDPLPASEGGGWQESVHVDLSEFAGYPQVFIAFVYEGLWADDWYIDDVVVDAHKPQLALSEASFEPDGVRPGETAALSFSVDNTGLAASGPLTVEILTDDEGIEVSPASAALTAVTARGSADAGPFEVSVAADHENHIWAPLTVRMDDGEHVFEEEVRLKIGRPASAFVQITHSYENDIQLFIGYTSGDGQPLYQLVQQDGGKDGAGVFTWDIDLFDYRGAFPPNISEQRWFVEVWDDSVGNTGTLDVFYLAEGDDVYISEGLPLAIPEGGEVARAWVPGRAELELAQLTLDPAQVAPGDTVSLSASAYNVSAPPRGALTGTLRTAEGDVTLVTEDPISFSYTPLSDLSGPRGLAVPDEPFVFEVASEHVSSESLLFTLLLDDGVDTWSLPLSVPVPYPVLGGPAVIVADDEVDGSFEDYGLSPTETTALRILSFNAGDLPTFGPVTATVTVLDDGGAGVSIPDQAYALQAEPGESVEGALAAGGRGKSGLIPVEIELGGLETVVILEVTLTDGVLSQTTQHSLKMLEPAHNPILPVPDVLGDDGGGGFDLTQGTFQLRDTYLQMRWVFDAPFNPEDVLLYSMVSSNENYRYAMGYIYGEAYFFRWVSAGDGGYWSKYSLPPSSFQAYPVDARTMEFFINLGEVGLSGRDLYGGAAVGVCGEGFCDYAPASAAVDGGLLPFVW